MSQAPARMCTACIGVRLTLRHTSSPMHTSEINFVDAATDCDHHSPHTAPTQRVHRVHVISIHVTNTFAIHRHDAPSRRRCGRRTTTDLTRWRGPERIHVRGSTHATSDTLCS